ncbi:ribonuclease PH [Roseiconus nitratireducens]|uniref:Ribonuclease PH n=1 Tax=Roseiconus nitratireducens TaxID=2605748 RepID=A0A5M6D7N2_9BACT|nr:ribonuclease PH [Roseiconus nitratireducens]KAA5542292.1 ribonuclease PH [Roseiconus nitratireducens]
MRPANELRPVEIQLGYLPNHPANVLYKSGQTIVLCAASVEPSVPPWLEGKGKGWVTAEYNMLPGSTVPRKRRERSKLDGRTTEIQRLIGRSLRAVVDLRALGERSIVVDCDVLQADGGTRTAAITGGFIALAKAIQNELPGITIGEGPLRDSIAAVSVGVIEDEVKLDLDYDLDFAADVDMNVVMTGSGRFVEIQGTGEEATFDDSQLTEMIAMARRGIEQLTQRQREVLQSA